MTGFVGTPSFPAWACLATISPIDPDTGERIALRISSVNDRRVTGLFGQVWEPAMTEAPTLTMRLFNGDFVNAVDAGSAALPVNLFGLRRGYDFAARMAWAGAPVDIMAGRIGDLDSWRTVFSGRVASYGIKDGSLSIVADVDREVFEADVLTRAYAGTSAAEGPLDLKDRVKPLVLGWASNVEPVLIDAVDSVYQFSGYGPIEAVTTLYERGAAFGAAEADHASYAALVAATIPPGKWATCLAEGLVRLGAPAFGVITGDIRGHEVDGATPRLTGAIIAALADIAGVPASRIAEGSLAAMDAAAPFPAAFVLTEQASFLDAAATLAMPCNHQSGVSLTGQFFVMGLTLDAGEDFTLDAQGRASPQVIESDERDVSPPFWKTVLGAARCWRVHSAQDIAFTADLVEMGRYSGATTYREGNIVDLEDGSRWLYVATTAAAGNAPPVWPTTSNAWWENTSPPLNAAGIRYIDGTPIENLQPAEAGATEGAPTGTPVGSITADDVDSTINSGGGVANNQVDTPALVTNAVTVPYLATSSTAISFAAATKTQVLLISGVVKQEDSSLLEVHGQVPMYGADSVDIYITYEAKQSSTVIASRQFRLEIDANGVTYLPFAYEHYFDALDAGTYDIYLYIERFSANACSTSGLYHMRVREFMR